MAKPNRMVLSISDELHQAFKEFSEATGVAASFLATELLEPHASQISETAKIIKDAKEGRIASVDKFKEMIAQHVDLLTNMEAQVDALKEQKRVTKTKGPRGASKDST